MFWTGEILLKALQFIGEQLEMILDVYYIFKLCCKICLLLIKPTVLHNTIFPFHSPRYFTILMFKKNILIFIHCELSAMSIDCAFAFRFASQH